MKEDNLENIFNNLQGSFDINEPAEGHQQRFLKKLQTQKKTYTIRQSKLHEWKPIAVAASVVFLITIGITIFYTSSPSIEEQVAKIAPEASQTQFYFANLINKQVQELKNESTPETKQIIDDALIQLKKLEENYVSLEKDIVNGGNSKLILSAMITNFQTRIDLLQDVLEQIDTIKNLNNYDDEDITI